MDEKAQVEVDFNGHKRKVAAHMKARDVCGCSYRRLVPDDIDGWEFVETVDGRWFALPTK